MENTLFYEKILGISAPWKLESVDMNLETQMITLKAVYVSPTGYSKCPQCDREAKHYDHTTERKWRHLDTCQMQTIIAASIPRVECVKHGVLQLEVPWASAKSRFSALFESLAIQWLKACQNQKKVAEMLRVTAKEIHGIMVRAVKRGLLRRVAAPLKEVGIDEKSMKKGHKYMTILCDLKAKVVHDLVEGRSKESSNILFSNIYKNQKDTLNCIAMDMWEPFMLSAQNILPNAKIIHDRFHISGYLNKAIDQTRISESKEIGVKGWKAAVKSKWLFLKNKINLSDKENLRFSEACGVAVKTAEAWKFKELFRTFWLLENRDSGEKFLKEWISSVYKSGLSAMIKVAEMIERKSDGILNYFDYKVTTAISENLNGQIQKIKTIGRGFSSFENYKIVILFHLGGLNLLPHDRE